MFNKLIKCKETGSNLSRQNARAYTRYCQFVDKTGSLVDNSRLQHDHRA